MPFMKCMPFGQSRLLKFVHVHSLTARGHNQQNNRNRLRRMAAGDTADPASDPDRALAEVAVSRFVDSNMLVGVGSGDLCTRVLQEIGRRTDAGELSGVKVVAASDAAATEAAFVGIPLALSADHDKIDVMFAEIDEVDGLDPSLPAIFGRSREPVQPQIPRFKGVANKAERFVALLSSEEQVVGRLGHELPVVVDADNWEDTAEEIDDIFVGEAEIWRRPASGVSNPKAEDNPYTSPENYNILDIKFGEALTLNGDSSAPYADIEREIMLVPGVVSLALLQDVVDVLVVRDAANGPKVVTKDQLLAEM